MRHLTVAIFWMSFEEDREDVTKIGFQSTDPETLGLQLLGLDFVLLLKVRMHDTCPD